MRSRAHVHPPLDEFHMQTHNGGLATHIYEDHIMMTVGIAMFMQPQRLLHYMNIFAHA